MHILVKVKSNKSFYLLQLVTMAILLNGAYLVFLGISVHYFHRAYRLSYFGIEIYPIIGLTLLFLSLFINKRKKSALYITLGIYSIYFLLALRQLFISH